MDCCGVSSIKSGLGKTPVCKDMDWLMCFLLSGLPQQIGIIPPFLTPQMLLKPPPLFSLLFCAFRGDAKSTVAGSVESNSGSILYLADTMDQC